MDEESITFGISGSAFLLHGINFISGMVACSLGLKKNHAHVLLYIAGNFQGTNLLGIVGKKNEIFLC